MTITEAMYAQGYALPLYSISADTRTWNYRDEEFTLPMDAVETFEIDGFCVASIDDIRAYART